ncbi:MULTISPECIES: glycosyltransferase 87 family protein [unclassified Luteococcus]|uniref:glycosyltransferase 87 family protein n=1 Tax=unclassified Luteococcus TaxID=2639923 RepID=UPI00313B7B28
MSHPSPSAPRSILTDRFRSVVVGNPLPWVVLWVISRAWMLHQWATDYTFIINDVRYYFSQLQRTDDYLTVLREYPMPVVWLLDALRIPIDDDVSLYCVLFALLMAVLDAGFAIWLWQSHSRVAAIYWMVFTFCMGPLIWFRYDLLAGVVVGAAVFQMARNPRLSGALMALGAGIKLWPALLLAPLLGRDRPARGRTLAFGLTGLGLATASLLVAGPARLISPITWQSGRGLQIESPWASVPMYLRAFGAAERQAGNAALRWDVRMSPYNAFEVFGPGVEDLLTASSVAMALGVLYAGWVAMRMLRVAAPAPLRALACLSIVLVMLSANKTLSPQYVVWLGAVTAAWLGLAPRGTERARAAMVASAGLLIALATQYVYPNHYLGLITPQHAESTVTAVLVARNLCLAGLTLLTVWWTVERLISRRFAQATRVTDNIAPR